MRYIDAPPSIQQLKRWCENKNAVTFQIRDLGNLCDTTILNVDSCSYGGEENNYVIVKIRLKSSRIWSSRVEEFALKDILGYSIPEKIDSIILKPTKFFKKKCYRPPIQGYYVERKQKIDCFAI